MPMELERDGDYDEGRGTSKRAKFNSAFSLPGSPSSRRGRSRGQRRLACPGPRRRGATEAQKKEEEEEEEGQEEDENDGEDDEDNDDVFSPRSPTARMCVSRGRSNDADAVSLPALRAAVSPESLAHLRALSAAQLRWADAARGGRTLLQAGPGEDRGAARRSLALLGVGEAAAAGSWSRSSGGAGADGDGDGDGDESDGDDKWECSVAARELSPTPTRGGSGRVQNTRTTGGEQLHSLATGRRGWHRAETGS